MTKKTKAERLADQQAMIDRAMDSADKIQSKGRPIRHSNSIIGKNIAKDAQIKLEKATQQIDELTKQIASLKENNTSPEFIQSLEKQIEDLRSKATLELNPNEVVVTRFANRDEIFFKTKEFYELVDSINENGQAIPITVRLSQEEDGFELISGRRRLEACKILNLPIIAILVEADDKKLTELQVLENFRDNLTHFEEADNFELMINEGFFKTNAELAKTFGVSEGKISQLRSIAKIPPWFRKLYLIKTTSSFKSLPSGKSKEIIELNIAPSRLCYELSRYVNDDFEHRYKADIEIHKNTILSIDDYSKRVKKIIQLLDKKSLPTSEPKKIHKTKIRFEDKVIGEITNANGTWQVKIPKKHNSKDLSQALEKAIQKTVNLFFEDKNQ